MARISRPEVGNFFCKLVDGSFCFDPSHPGEPVRDGCYWDVEDDWGDRSFEVEDSEAPCNFGDIERLLEIEALTGVRLKDGQSPRWFLSVYADYCERAKQHPIVSFGRYCQKYQPGRVVIAAIDGRPAADGDRRGPDLDDQAAPADAAALEETADGQPQGDGDAAPEASKPRRRRRKGNKEPRPLTPNQAEVVQIVGECKGNIAEAARRLGKDRKTVAESYRVAMEKLGKQVVKHQTKRLSTDRRGQENLSPDDDRRG